MSPKQPSGAGKTTLFRCLTGLTRPDTGSVAVNGQELMSLRGRALGAARGDVAFIFQQFNLIRRVSAMQNVLVGRLAQTPTWRVVSRRFSYADRQLAPRCAVVATGVAVVASLHQVHLALEHADFELIYGRNGGVAP